MSDERVEYLPVPNWSRSHRWRRAVWNTMARIGLIGVHGLPMSRRWIEIHRRPMPMAGLDPAFDGFKIVQLSDLHYSPVVWRRYLVQFVRWVNELEPDLVVVTGDLVTGGMRYADRVGHILKHVKARHGVICTFGNHDYSMFGKNGSAHGKMRADHLEASLESHGLNVLRNEVATIYQPTAAKPLVIVGLDDEWSGHIDPDLAYRGVDPSHPIICLNHNPANVLELMDYPWQWMLSGHTHGRQLGTGKISKRFMAKKFRHYTHGYYSVQGRHLYVNRGLSYGQRIKYWCRPEVTLFKLEAADLNREENAGHESKRMGTSHHE